MAGKTVFRAAGDACGACGTCGAKVYSRRSNAIDAAGRSP